MKISEIKERKIIHRPTLDFDEDGKRIYHAYEYYLPYNPGFKNSETQRLFAKWIDMAVFSLIFISYSTKCLLSVFCFQYRALLFSGQSANFISGLL